MSVGKITWFKTSATTYELARSHRGYTAEIVYSASGYEITITGDDAPSATEHTTLRQAKNVFRKFLFSIPVNNT